jgi:hypothetical protein
MAEGRILFSGAPEELKKQVGKASSTLEGCYLAVLCKRNFLVLKPCVPLGRVQF